MPLGTERESFCSCSSSQNYLRQTSRPVGQLWTIQAAYVPQMAWHPQHMALATTQCSRSRVLVPRLSPLSCTPSITTARRSQGLQPSCLATNLLTLCRLWLLASHSSKQQTQLQACACVRHQLARMSVRVCGTSQPACATSRNPTLHRSRDRCPPPCRPRARLCRPVPLSE